MRLPRIVARLNRVGLNRVTIHIVPHVPGFGLLVHRGRRSGRKFRTPINVFPTKAGFRIALTYGPESDWVRNVLAAGSCEVVTRGRTIALTNPRLVRDPHRDHIWTPARQILALLRVDDFLDLDRAATPVSSSERCGEIEG